VFQSFYLSRRWLPWAFPGAALILFATWYKVELDVKINEWFGDFYNLIQKALGRTETITMDEYMQQLATFGYIAGLYVTIAVFTDFFIKHYVFRWRTAMNDYYAANWHAVRGIEGASQRVQEDTMRFARLMEGLGVSFMRSVMTLFAFLPILWPIFDSALPQVIERAWQFAPQRGLGTTRSGLSISCHYCWRHDASGRQSKAGSSPGCGSEHAASIVPLHRSAVQCVAVGPLVG
jgi:ABC-type long-subunit fatty acid transport system fused permease/ATPase subunit